MSFMYPRTISLVRPTQASAEGAVGYGGQTPDSEQPIAAGLSANIQLDRQGRRNRVDLPGDGNETQWNIFVPATELAKGMAKDRDVVIDDESVRYQVVAAYWNSLGYQLACIRLQV